MIQAKDKTGTYQYIVYRAGIYGAELCISPAPLFVGNAQSAFDPYVFLRLYPWEECGDVLRRSFRPFTGPFLQRAFWLLYPYLYLYRLCQRHFYQVLLRRLHHPSADTQYFQRNLVQHVYICIPFLNPRTSESSLLFQEHHASGDYIYCSYHSF